MTHATIVGWDGSSASRAALDWAARRARRHGGGLHVLRVLGPFPFVESEALWADEVTAASIVSLDDEIARLRTEHPGLAVTSELVSGDATEILLDNSSPQTVLVIGTRHRSAPYFRFAWSFGGQLAGHARGPVVIVPETSPQDARGIVVGVDSSPESDAAVVFAAREADRDGSPLDLVHAWLGPLMNPIRGGDIEGAPWLEDAHRRVLAEASALVGRAAPDLLHASHLDVGTASHALLDRARDAELVVVGARGRGPLASLVLGSVSTALLESMPCPIAILGPGTVAGFSLASLSGAVSR
ncbi:Universal stress protein [Frondihabitans sp. 762G35]|uniref:universal stress protein n=1 Tax=Frondihabitans sp. 762G35 TaxID=1446794 RepID=UPI000D223FFB|nr:universal stress protein [Frondihabitans sp. 762G35]ARC56981.1 Universal stress protein [Frondihabitans sp. 762G35]